jgi:dienelactone hydrolase
VLIAALLLSAGGVSACSPLGGHPPHRRAGAAAPARHTEDKVSAPPATTAPAPASPQAAVGFTAFNVAGFGGDVAVQVFYPASAPGSGTAVLRTGAPYPLIVFSPGFDIDPAAYTPLMDAWAQAGFVVAEPSYPFTAPGAPGGLNEADILNHPADMRTVIDRILALSESPSGLLARAVDPARIGVAGHSDGGDVADAVVANTCCLDARVKAAAMFAGAELTSFRGSYSAISVPALVVQGDADQVNAPGCSQQIYNDAGPTRFYLDLHGAGHHAPYLQGTGPPPPGAAAYRQAVQRVSVLFWQGYLRGDTAALSTLSGLGPSGVPGATLYAGSPVAQTGACPGAPQ